MTESEFWELISRLNWAMAPDDDAVIAPVVEALAAGPVNRIYNFREILAEKLFLLDTSDHAHHIGEGAYTPDGDKFSPDGFLFARCCAVANGRAAYEQIRKDPASMPKNLEFAPLLRIANESYSRKTGKIMRHVPAYPIESGSNKTGWGK